jgi:RHS repeat-associated protein
MSNKSGIDGKVISLPKGGGSLHGIGEKFSPDLHTGTGNFTVPIALPPGRNRFQPQVNLVYSTGNGNGPFGFGWGLSIPGVSRKTSKGVPFYDDSRDAFILSGAEDLVSVGKPGAVQYRPRTEGLFAHIVRHYEAVNDFWEIKSKDGLVSLYGTPKAAGHDPAVVANPDHTSKVFSWKLTSTVDPFGNRIDYLYERDAIPSDGPRRWDQLYLSEIRYADHGDPDNPQFLVTVKFIYEKRPDPFSEYRAGFEIRTVQRCKRIEIYTHAGVERLTWAYHLTYLDQRGLSPERLPLNGVSLLSLIQVEGRDGAQSELLPPLEFGYSRFEPEGKDFFPIAGPDLPLGSLARQEYELADVLGNGLPDIIEMNGAARYWRNLGNGAFDLPRLMRDAPAGLMLADPGVQLIDADGDGRIDLLATVEGLSGYCSLRFDGEWDRRSFRRCEQAPSFNLEDPEVKLVDLDGDGVTDAIRSGTRLECFFNDPEVGWKSTRFVERRALEDFPNVNFSDPRVKWGDMSGDSLQDIVLVYDGNVEYWPNLGRGAWGKCIHMRNSPRFPYGHDPKRILVGDMDGDGLADIIYVDDTKLTLWINQSGNAWSKPIEITGTPPVSDMDAVRLADMLGAGVSGVLWSKDVYISQREHYFFLDFTGGVKPYLLDEMDNHMGAVTRVEYKPSTSFYLEDQKRPKTRWRTPLPFPVQVVARVEVIDEISGGKLTTEYSYHHGYWDGAEREFRGFGRVDQRDTEVFELYHNSGLHAEHLFTPVDAKQFSPPLETRAWFHQGPVGDEFEGWKEPDFSDEFWQGDQQMLERPQEMKHFLNGLPRRDKRDALRALRGRILRTELYSLDDDTERQERPYTVTEYLHGLREESPPSAGENGRQRIFFPHTLAQRVTQWERGEDPMTQFSFTEDYDDCGQLLKQTQIACPRGWKNLGDVPNSPFLATRTLSTYAKPASPQGYIKDRVARTTTYEIVNDGSQAVLGLKNTPDASSALEIIGQSINYYDGTPFEGGPFGQVGQYGAVVRAETLILTETILQAAYAEVPPYLEPGVDPTWTPDYPQEFRARLKEQAGYVFYEGGPNDEHKRGWFAVTGQQYDFHDPQAIGRGLPVVTRDSLGRDTKIAYDAYQILPAKVTDPAGLTTKAKYDYRVLQPNLVTDPNRNRTHYAYTPLGLLQSTAVMGREGENKGDTDQAPSTSFEYDFLAFDKHQQPISVRTIRRIHHASDTDVDPAEMDDAIQTVEYSDGFGRLLQTRTQAEDITFGGSLFGDAGLPADQSTSNQDATGRFACPGGQVNVVVSGWQTYDNKGRVVEKYEPFFACGWEYHQPTSAENGQKAEMHYDPRGQVIRAINPNNSQQRVIYGIPTDLNDPAHFTPTPWEVYTYDENDNAGRTHNDEALGYQSHWNTPSSAVVDALGRKIKSVERNGTNPADWHTTEFEYDIRGNLVAVKDALGRNAFAYVYDLTPKRGDAEEDQGAEALRIQQLDAGVRRIVFDAAGNEIERRDGKGALILRAYDDLNRPIRLWARDKTGEAITLRERLIYGDSVEAALAPDQLDAANLRGELYKHYDEAGLLTFEAYDFKGNVLEKNRQVISDAAILAVFNPPLKNWEVKSFRVDWEPPAGMALEIHAIGLLDPTVYQTSFSYDGLNRVKVLRYPQDVDGERKELRPTYNRAGALESVKLDDATYVKHIAYNAKGQRTLIAYGNGIMTRYAYDPRTFRLVRLRSERYTMPADFAFHPTGESLQDFAYEYDLAGNILKIKDRAPGSGIPNSLQGLDALDRRFTYDPLYRLLSATGRECDTPPPPMPWDDTPKCQDVTRTRPYTENYTYDPVGNMGSLVHTAGEGSFTRTFTLEPGANRLQTMAVGATATYSYAFDANGNMTRETTSRHFEWDHSDRMRVFRNQVDGSQPTIHTHYLYDSDGQRVKKLVRKQNGAPIETTVYIAGMFEQHARVQGGVVHQNNSLHVMDGEKRIALVRVGNPLDVNDDSPKIQYHLGDHLSSSNLVVGADGVWTNREEFTPFGESSFGGFSEKRYRFTSKERDDESGLNYHEARYYAAWHVRWLSCDPTRIASGKNVYAYAVLNPLRFIDPSGADDEPLGLDPEILSRVRETHKARAQSNEQPPPLLDRHPKIYEAPPDPPYGYRPVPKEGEPFWEYDARLQAWKRYRDEMMKWLSAQEPAPSFEMPPKITFDRLVLQKTLAERMQQAVIYLRRNPRTGQIYVGRTTGDEFGRFLKRQTEHGKRLGEAFEWRILEYAEYSGQRKAEEDWIRRFGGPSRYGGRLANYRYEMNEEDYQRVSRALGRPSVPIPTPNRAKPTAPTDRFYQNIRNTVRARSLVRRAR